MKEAIVTIESTALVSAAAQANYASIYRLLAPLPGVEIVETEQMFRITTPALHPLMNGVFRTVVSDMEADEVIASTLRHFSGRSLPMSWTVFSGSQPTDLPQRLKAHGVTASYSMPIMAVDIDTLPPVPLSDGHVEVRPVVGEEAAGEWCDVLTHGSGLPRAVSELFMALQRLYPGDDAPYRNFIAYRDGQPAGASAAFASDGVIGIYCVAVTPEARRQGIGTAVTTAAALDGKRWGHQVAVLEASAMGEPVYRKLGFETIDIITVMMAGVPQ